MSLRSSSAYASVARRRRPGPVATAVPWALAAATIIAQVAYPLVHGQARNDLTDVTVVLFFLASASHAVVWRGLPWAAGFVVVTVGAGLLVEAVGLLDRLPVRLLHLRGLAGTEAVRRPVGLPLAWSMMAYPALVAGRRLAHGRWTTPLVAGLALASWDVFLDPQMVAAGHWAFDRPRPSPPLLGGIPWTNFAGWFLTAVVLMAVLDRLPRRPADDRQPALLYLWTYVSFVVANLFFFHEPRVALAGGLVMGAIALPYAWTLWSERP